MFKRLTVSIAALVVAAPMFAQSPAKSIPRTPDGKPDFSGIWQTGGISLTGGPQGNVVAAKPAAPASGPPAGRGAAPKPTGEYADLPTQPPLQPWAAERVKTLENKDDPTVHCFAPGVPRAFSMPMPFEIVQTPKRIAILYEAFRAYRLVYLDGTGPIGERLPSYMGDSVGRWEGDTLVVEASKFNSQIWGPGNMRVTSDQYRVTERYTHQGDTIAYEARIEDPKVLTGPFVFRTTFRRPPETSIAEYECLEYNIDLPRILAQ